MIVITLADLWFWVYSWGLLVHAIGLGFAVFYRWKNWGEFEMVTGSMVAVIWCCLWFVVTPALGVYELAQSRP